MKEGEGSSDKRFWMRFSMICVIAGTGLVWFGSSLMWRTFEVRALAAVVRHNPKYPEEEEILIALRVARDLGSPTDFLTQLRSFPNDLSSSSLDGYSRIEHRSSVEGTLEHREKEWDISHGEEAANYFGMIKLTADTRARIEHGEIGKIRTSVVVLKYFTSAVFWIRSNELVLQHDVLLRLINGKVVDLSKR